jgi:hypothetical protein
LDLLANNTPGLKSFVDGHLHWSSTRAKAIYDLLFSSVCMASNSSFSYCLSTRGIKCNRKVRKLVFTAGYKRTDTCSMDIYEAHNRRSSNGPSGEAQSIVCLIPGSSTAQRRSNGLISINLRTWCKVPARQIIRIGISTERVHFSSYLYLHAKVLRIS